MTPLRTFLQATSLSTDTMGKDDDAEKEVRTAWTIITSLNDHQKVIISTCHAAKGLEWPVVFVPSGESSDYESSKT